MPGLRAVQNLQMPHSRDWQDEQIPCSSPGGGGGGARPYWNWLMYYFCLLKCQVWKRVWKMTFFNPSCLENWAAHQEFPGVPVWATVLGSHNAYTCSKGAIIKNWTSPSPRVFSISFYCLQMLLFLYDLNVRAVQLHCSEFWLLNEHRFLTTLQL